MLSKNRETKQFSWEDLGNIQIGRPNLGNNVPVEIFRLYLYSIRDVLVKKYGVENASDFFRDAGKLAGIHFCKKYLNVKSDFDVFISDLRKIFFDLKMGDVRIESVDLENFNILLTIAEDLDCSGLPITEEEICDYEEGFLAGVFREYMKKEFIVREIDCWANGGRICRFRIKYKTES
ncbi:MAG: 4-vinyl reductase [Ignavibacteria bacterium]|nr:4-vinyl reductase [Ignavibacteria bacterium]